MIDHGLRERDYAAEPVGSSIPAYGGAVFPRKHWPELIGIQESRRASPLDVHKYNETPILDQGRLKYCWAFSTVAAVMNRYAFAGINSPVPHLSATAPAAQGKGFRNRGGHCSESCRYIDQFGIPTIEAWPEQDMDRDLVRSDAAIQSASRHHIIDFEDIGDDLDAAISAMIDPAGASPCTFSLPWWRHAICGLKIRYRGPNPAKIESYGLQFVNSYGDDWGNSGYGTIWGNQIVGQEYIIVKQVKPRTESE